MDEPLQLIRTLVAPVIMISANGLICLALYNRLASIVSRARTFHREHFEVLSAIVHLPEDQKSSPLIQHQQKRAEHLEIQAQKVLQRAFQIRAALIFLLLSVLFMLGCSAALGMSYWSHTFDILSVVLFGLGVLCMACGCVQAIIELTRALDPVIDEAESLKRSIRPLEQASEKS